MAPLVTRLYIANSPQRSFLFGARKPWIPDDITKYELLQQQKLVKLVHLHLALFSLTFFFRWLLLNSTDPAQELQWLVYELQRRVIDFKLNYLLILIYWSSLFVLLVLNSKAKRFIFWGTFLQDTVTA